MDVSIIFTNIAPTDTHTHTHTHRPVDAAALARAQRRVGPCRLWLVDQAPLRQRRRCACDIDDDDDDDAGDAHAATRGERPSAGAVSQTCSSILSWSIVAVSQALVVTKLLETVAVVLGARCDRMSLARQRRQRSRRLPSRLQVLFVCISGFVPLVCCVDVLALVCVHVATRGYCCLSLY
jgi:hypothetical protein